MLLESITVLHLVKSQLQFGNLFGNEGPIEFGLDVATGIFSLLLFVITLYAWARRGRQPTLLIVSIGFLTFFVKQFVEILPLSNVNGELFNSAMDFLTLTLFFLALVVRPKRNALFPEKIKNR
jgi:hypothetical protein